MYLDLPPEVDDERRAESRVPLRARLLQVDDGRTEEHVGELARVGAHVVLIAALVLINPTMELASGLFPEESLTGKPSGSCPCLCRPFLCLGSRAPCSRPCPSGSPSAWSTYRRRSWSRGNRTQIVHSIGRPSCTWCTCP